MLSAIKRRWRLILLLISVGVLGGIGHAAWPFLTYPVTELTFDTATPLAPEEIDVPLAGVAEVDITPAIGLPKYGYSAFATDANGFRTRLKARAFYLHGPGDTPLALVQLDLGSGSLILHKQVANLIAASTDVPAHGLSLMVTHTHTGPANYLSSDFYNAFGAQRAGFDPKVFEFLSSRIALAVEQAYQNRRPARLATGNTEAWGLTRNRSLAAWARNHDIDEALLSDDMIFDAVNPTMRMLRIDLQADNGCYYPAGALTTFSVHGTAIPAQWDPYHGDVWTAFSGALKSEHAASDGNCSEPSPFAFVHGTVQATHGDNNPDVQGGRRGPIEANRIGTALGAKAQALHQQLADQLEARLDSTVASRELSLIGGDAQTPLCERAIIGAATAGAANDDEVFPISYLPFLKEGWGRSTFTDGCHGEKQWMLSKLQLLLPADRYPNRALLQVIQVNDLVLATAPWEITLEAGNRIRAGVAEQLNDASVQVEVISLANGFFGYATTPEEYSAQYYEGGHTIYGPGTVPFLTDRLATLAHDMVAQGAINDIPAQGVFRLATRQYWPEADDRNDAMSIHRQARYFRAEANHEPYWQIEVTGPAPGNLSLHQPLLRVEQQIDGEWQIVETDDGLNLSWLLSEETDTGARYLARWYNPAHEGDATYRFVVLDQNQQPLPSEPF